MTPVQQLGGCRCPRVGHVAGEAQIGGQAVGSNETPNPDVPAGDGGSLVAECGMSSSAVDGVVGFQVT